MSLRADIRCAAKEGRYEDLEELIANDPRTVRHLLGLTYSADPEIRAGAARGIALAARHHQRLVKKTIQRLVWAMNEESGTNAVGAPEVLEAIAKEKPRLLIPVVPDLIRLTTDNSLRKGLRRTLRAVADGCPGEVGARLEKDLSEPEKRLKREIDQKARKRR